MAETAMVEGHAVTATRAFLFTDIEGSTKRWEHHPDAMAVAYLRHDVILRDAIVGNGGAVYKVIGDAFQAAFPSANEALAAALQAQRLLTAEAWDASGLPEPLRVRMAVHAGAVNPDATGDYRSPVLNRLGRLLGAGHGGQTIVSQAVFELAGDRLPHEAALGDLGEHQLKDLSRPERIYQLRHPELPVDFPPLATLTSYPNNNLPVEPTPLVGREAETAAVRAQLERDGTRLITLTGPGGVGKTRLSLQVAADALDRFPDGAWLVPLAAITDPALVAGEIALTLGVREEAGRPLEATLADHLRDRRMLLVLDNLEQVLTGAKTVATLLAASPGLRIIATSRTRLGLRGEVEYVVPTLSVPDLSRLPPPERLTDYESVRLFVQRAVAAKPAFVVDDANARAVAAICRRLDGLPLAIELAAARVKLLAPDALLRRLEQRLPLLTGGARDLLPHQRTLRGAIAWSYDLLTEAERTLFRHLAIFAGGWTLESVEALADSGVDAAIDPFDGVVALVDQSLVRQEDGADGEPRFSMLQTIREYGREQLAQSGEDEELSRWHASHFLDLAEQAEPALTGPDQGDWLGRLEAEHDNLRATLGWATERDAETALRLGAALWRFWMIRGYQTEGYRWLQGALAAGGGTPPAVRAAALRAAGVLAELRADLVQAKALHEESLAIARAIGDRGGTATSLRNLGVVAQEQRDYGTALAHYAEALTLHRADGDRRGLAATMTNMGKAVQEQGDDARASALYEEALALVRTLGDRQATAGVLMNLGVIAADQGMYPKATACYEEALSLARALGDRWTEGSILYNLGVVAAEQDEPTQAMAFFGEAIALARELEDQQGVAYALIGLGDLACERGEIAAAVDAYKESLLACREIGDQSGAIHSLFKMAALAGAGNEPERAARLFGAAAGLCELRGNPCSSTDRAGFERDEAIVRTTLGETAFAAACQEGRSLSFAGAVDEALAARATISSTVIA